MRWASDFHCVYTKCRHLGQSRDPTKRSINLALSYRGLCALDAMGVGDKVRAGCIRMPCRAIHSLDGTISTQPYGLPGQCIYSASRSLLNNTVLEECEKQPTLKIFFEHKLESLLDDGTTIFTNLREKAQKRVRSKLVVGSDGAYSSVRTAMLRLARIDFSRTYIPQGYKELNMPPTAAGDFAMPVDEALHIWPRHDFMLIALPNPDKTFTCTLFLPWEQLDELDADPAKARSFFENHFPDALARIPEFEKQFSEHPSSALVMIKTDPWNLKDKAVLIGDAAHSIVPFYGQGANAAFEDCLEFVACLDDCKGDLSAATLKFAKQRKPQGDAIAKLSLDNYLEMRHKTATTAYLLHKKLDMTLHRILKDAWLPQYSMVSFSRIPYKEVIERVDRQNSILAWSAAAITAGVLAGGVYAAIKAGLPRWIAKVVENKL
jgi:kynurenine 3-monooxygenase